MQIISASFPFTFNYGDSNQTPGLNISARIYDVTSGIPVLLGSVVLSVATGGVYCGNYQGQGGKTYLVICSVYTDSSFTSLDPNYSPGVECYKDLESPATQFPFNYGAFDGATTLDVAAEIYDTSLGAPAFLQQSILTEVFGGIYFGYYNGIFGHSYQIVKLVFTDGTYTVRDPDRPPGVDSFQIFPPTAVTNIFRSATLVGQKYSANLRAGPC